MGEIHAKQAPDASGKGNFGEVFLTALQLGLASFGGPTAHIGYFREKYVNRKKWLSERSFADLVALCQFLPGPASSQLGMAIGINRCGLRGALAAWLGFTLPSAVIMVLFAVSSANANFAGRGWLQGLMLAAAAVVAIAVWSMGRTLATGPIRGTLAVGAAVSALLIPGPAGQLLPLAAGAIAGVLWLRPAEGRPDTEGLPETASGIQLTYRTAYLSLVLFFVLLIGLPLAARTIGSPLLSLADSCYRAGSLVFGGGHVVLPILQQEVVGQGAGKLTEAVFASGYGAVQAMPGPLFTFAAYIGGAAARGWSAVLYGTVALLAVFAPAFLLLAGALPFWQTLRRNRRAQAALSGINAVVVGLLLAALYDPIWTESVRSARHFVIALVTFLLLFVWKRQPWQAVAFAAGAGWLLL